MKPKLPGQGEIIRLTAENAFRRETVNGDVFLEGWATTESLNSYNQIVLAKSFKWKGGLSLFNGRVLAFHEQRKEPVGRCEALKIVPGKGLWVRVRIFAEAGPLYHRNLEEGMLNAFSIGFRYNKYEYDEKKDIITFTECELHEISVVNIGANKEALFTVVNSLMEALPDNQSEPTTNYMQVGDVEIPSSDTTSTAADGVTLWWEQSTEDGNTWNLITRREPMADPKLKAGDVDPVLLKLDMFETEKQELTKNYGDLKQLQHDMQAELADFKANSISKTDFLQKATKMQEDLDTLSESVEKGLNAVRHDQEEVFQYEDYRSLLSGMNWLQHDDGQPYSDLDYRAHALFHMPLDYNNFARGQELRNLRNLQDAVKCVNAQGEFQKSKGKRYRLEDTKLWHQFTAAVNRFDNVLALAMAGGNAGYGAEWVPESFSAEFNAYLRLQPNLPNKFKMWPMPPSSSGKYPFQNGRAVVYAGSENLVDSGAQARKTNVATGATTFTPVMFIGALVTSEILTEDTVLNLVAMIRQELATAVWEALESAIINGDTAGTHFDNTNETQYQTYEVETKILGLRALADDNSNEVDIETLGGSGILALVWENFVELKSMLGRASVSNPEDCIWITGAKGRRAVQHALHSEVDYGMIEYLINGKIPHVDGSEMYISGMYNEELESTGIGHSTNNHTSLLCAHKPSFRIASRGGVTLEVNKDILTQQQQFVATARYDFGTVCASDVNPVSCGMNIQWA